MPSPVVAGTAESATTTAGTSHVLNWTGLGTVAAGDLLIIILDKGSTAATVNAHADWTELLDENVANGLYIAYRWAVGGESAPTLTTSASTRSAEITYRITGAANPATQAPQIGTTATGTSATPDPPASATPGSSKDYLFIAFAGMAGEEADDDTWGNTPPTNYTPSPPRQKSCGTVGTNLGGLILAAERQLTTGSAENPGTFGVDVSAAWRAQTIMIHPDPNVSLAAGSNTITTSAPTVPAVHLTMPEDANTITVTAPAQSQLVEIALAAGQNTITVSAPAQTELHAVTLAAGQNTIIVSAPAQTELHAVTLAAGQNTIAVSAPVASIPEPPLAAGQNTVTVSAPTVPAVHLTMPQTVNTITVTAGTATLLVGIQPKKNLQVWSEDFSNTVWLTNNNGDFTGADLTYNSTTAPDGTTTAAYMEEDTTGLFHNIMTTQVTFAHDRTYVNASIHVKPDTLEFFYIAMYDYSIGSYQRNAIFQGFRLVGAGELIDAYTGLGVNYYYGDRSTAGAHTATIEALPNGWYRISAGGFLEKPSAGFVAEFGLGKPPVGVPGSMDAEQYFDWNGDGVSGLWVWGAQIEEFTNKSQYIKTTSTTITNDVLTFGGVTTTITAPTAVLDQNLLSAGQNTITVTAPTVAAVHLSVPVTVNTITVTAPDASIIADAGALAAGQNTITISAPIVPSLALTMPQTANTITVTAPEETILVETTLAAGQNTITLSAPEETTLAEITLAAGQNTITLSAPEETISAAVTLTAGQNTVTLSAPTVPSLALTMPQSVNTITLTAGNAELIQAGNLLADANIITLSAPTIPAVHLTMPQTVNTVTITAPTATVNVVVTATANTVTLSAPTASMQVDAVVPATVNTITVSAPVATLLSLDQYVEAAVNTVTVSAPVLAGVHLTHVLESNTVTVTAPSAGVTVTFDSILTPGSATINVRAPILTVQHQYLGTAIYRETALIQITKHETMKV